MNSSEEKLTEALEWVTIGAKSNAECAFLLGWLAENGFMGIPQSDEKAFRWYEKAANIGSAAAHARLAYMYESGRGVEVSGIRAYFHAKRAANMNLPTAQLHLAALTLLGIGVAPSECEARIWLEKAERAGLERASELLSSIGGKADELMAVSLEGSALINGDEEDVRRGIDLLTKAARMGGWGAAMQLSLIYGKGLSGVPADSQKSNEYFELAEKIRLRNSDTDR